VTLGAAVVQRVAANEHLAVAFRQEAQHVPDLVTALARDHVLRRVDRPLVGREVAERRGLLAQGLIQGSGHLGGGAQRTHGGEAQLRVLCDVRIGDATGAVPAEVRLRASYGGEPGVRWELPPCDHAMSTPGTTTEAFA
jgi:hypothetical protein